MAGALQGLGVHQTHFLKMIFLISGMVLHPCEDVRSLDMSAVCLWGNGQWFKGSRVQTWMEQSN